MSDLIKREDAIMWFEPYADRGLKIPIETVIQNLKDIPSAEHLIYEEMEKADIEAKAYAKGFKEGLEARKQGEWEVFEDADGIYGLCSVCGYDADFLHYGEPYRFCPNCGSDMRGEHDD